MRKKKRWIVALACFAMAASMATACSTGIGRDDAPRAQFRSYETPKRDNASERNDRGFPEGFQPSDLNPNVITGRNNLYTLDSDAEIMAEIATTVRGVKEARVHIIGGTAHVNVKIAKGANAKRVQKEVRERVQKKMPRYKIDVERLMEIGG